VAGFSELTFPRLIADLNARIARALKTLLEDRHLYQKETIEGAEIAVRTTLQSMTTTAEQKYLGDMMRVAGVSPTRLGTSADRSARIQGSSQYGGTFYVEALALSRENIKIFCPTCDGREVAAPVSFIQGGKGEDQIFLLVFQCQHCKKGCVSFLVKHEGWTLFLHGRSPMETPEIQPFIPKQERKYFRDAVIAFNSGKTLAALFYLRTFVDQFARRQTGKRGRENGEVIMAAYSETLPAKLRDSMPSLGKAYSDLSDAIHEPREDAVLFENATAAIEEHFDIRRVFKIADAETAPTGPKEE
jgi:hypothetical protein